MAAADLHSDLHSHPSLSLGSNTNSKATELQLHGIFLDFFDQEMYTDVVFEVKCGDDTVTYKAHKLPLAIWSPYFADLFYGCNGSPQGPVSITDVSPNVFSVMLKFMYESVCELTNRRRDVDFLLKLYKAAIRYQIEALECICRNNLANMTPDKTNVFLLLDAAHMMNHDGIRSKCFHLLESRTAEILANQRDLGHVPLDMMITILKLERVSFPSEYDLVMWVFAWGKNKYVESDNRRSFRSILDDILGHVDFTAMTAEQFSKVLSNYENVFSDSDAVKIFRNIADDGYYDLPDWASAKIAREYKYRG